MKPRLPLSVVLKENGYHTAGEAEAIAAYDERMRAYYAARTDNQKAQGWSEQMAGLLGREGRPHMLEFLRSQGLSRADITAGRPARRTPKAPDGVSASPEGAKQFDLRAAVHHHLQAGILGQSRGLVIDHADLAPQDAGADFDGLSRDFRQVLGLSNTSTISTGRSISASDA